MKTKEPSYSIFFWVKITLNRRNTAETLRERTLSEKTKHMNERMYGYRGSMMVEMVGILIF